MADLIIARSVAEMRAAVADWRAEGLRVGLVPTMGALHAGHLSLVRRAREDAERVIATIFVNPTQFAPHEDLDTYPRREAEDLAALRSENVDMVFMPDRAEMYPEGESTTVTVAGPAQGLESVSRPHFFQGVATVVSKLLIQAQADVAVFGNKDYQQLAVIKRMATDLWIPTQIIGGETVRDEEGLALSSRNAYLSAEDLSTARSLNKIMRRAVTELLAGSDTALDDGHQALLDAGYSSVDYFSAQSTDLGPYVPGAEGRLLVAAFLNGTRLIDNIAIPAG
ncbi:MAG: pantoate--beta-alanine ligase [Pikeienuella sp.]